MIVVILAGLLLGGVLAHFFGRGNAPQSAPPAIAALPTPIATPTLGPHCAAGAHPVLTRIAAGDDSVLEGALCGAVHVCIAIAIAVRIGGAVAGAAEDTADRTPVAPGHACNSDSDAGGASAGAYGRRGESHARSSHAGGAFGTREQARDGRYRARDRAGAFVSRSARTRRSLYCRLVSCPRVTQRVVYELEAPRSNRFDRRALGRSNTR